MTKAQLAVELGHALRRARFWKRQARAARKRVEQLRAERPSYEATIPWELKASTFTGQISLRSGVHVVAATIEGGDVKLYLDGFLANGIIATYRRVLSVDDLRTLSAIGGSYPPE